MERLLVLGLPILDLTSRQTVFWTVVLSFPIAKVARLLGEMAPQNWPLVAGAAPPKTLSGLVESPYRVLLLMKSSVQGDGVPRRIVACTLAECNPQEVRSLALSEGVGRGVLTTSFPAAEREDES